MSAAERRGGMWGAEMTKAEKRKVMRVYRAAIKWSEVIDRVERPYTETAALYAACAALQRKRRRKQ